MQRNIWLLADDPAVVARGDVEELPRFHDALVPGGFLVLGKVETLLGPTRSLFSAVDPRERIFRRR